MIIVDMGSGNSCRNNLDYAKLMVKTVAELDTRKHTVVLKWQLFEKAGDNIPLLRELFPKLHAYAWSLGYDTTASVFDAGSLEYLLRFDIPFVKIANRRDLQWLADMVPDGTRVIKSVDKPEIFQPDSMCCVSKYPATMKQYEKIFPAEILSEGISDHTANWDLYEKYKPELYECHFCLDDSTGLDAQSFARRPKQMREIL